MNVFGITGWKNSGKTTLVVKLVEHFRARGMRVATVKHAHHDFDIDIPGTDSFRHRKAGAEQVAVVSQKRWAIIRELEDRPEPQLEEVLAQLSPVDLVIVEGYKIAGHPKIQVIRPSQPSSNKPMPDNINSIVALAADEPIEVAHYAKDCPVLDLNNIAEVGDFICRYLSITR